MKILIVHTYYKHTGGEDKVFQHESTLLSETEEVEAVLFNNKGGLKGALDFLFSIWNIRAALKIEKLIKEFKPDVMHVHNWHFASGPLIIKKAGDLNVPVVVTLHNYRLLCPSAILLSNGELFTDSIKSEFPWKAIIKKVYRDSYIQTFYLAFLIWFHKKCGTWKSVRKYIVLTDFAKKLFVDSSFGIPEKKFVVKPNFVTGSFVNNGVRGSHFLFVGRLSEEKGIETLLDVFSQIDYALHIAGDGPLKEKVLDICSRNSNIKYLGHLDKLDIHKELEQCTALIFPSIWYEGMPMTLLEAFSLGTPVIASNMGAMSSMIQHGYNGLHFSAGDPLSLKEQLAIWVKMSSDKKVVYGKNAFQTYMKNYTPEKNKEKLTAIYKDVINENSN